jgi:iron(III) transport system substrate-binding protein
MFGFTDTDDFNHAVEEVGDEVTAVYPDQGDGELGTMVIPNTVCILKGAPHLEGARKLVDWLVSKKVEEKLAFGRSRQIPVRTDVPHPEGTKVPGKDFRAMKVDWDAVAGDDGKELDRRLEEIQKLLGWKRD